MTLVVKSPNQIETAISPIEEVIADAQKGRMYILVDAEDRENEGDLIIPAECADAGAINFMARYGRGLICLALDKKRAEQLELEYMVQQNRARNQTAFTVSIEAREGISTGISAEDRALTIKTAVNPQKGSNDLVSPGHVFPLIAREGGVLVRAGHTEAAVDISRLAGLRPSGVICEIMNDDGSMARLDDLIPFAKTHGLKIGTIADLIAYRRQHDHLVQMMTEQTIESLYGGEFRCRIYGSKLEPVEHIALIKGEITPEKDILVRMHGVNVLKDMLGMRGKGHGVNAVRSAMEKISEAGCGVIVLIRHAGATAISSQLSMARPNPKETSSKQGNKFLEYGIGAQILADLGVTRMVLLSNSTLPNIIGLESYGIEIVGQEALDDQLPQEIENE